MEEIQSEDAPAPIGPYSQAIRTGDTIYVSGQGPADPDSREVEVVSIREQTAQVLNNASAVLAAAGASLEDVVEATVYLHDMADYEAFNAEYADHFSAPYPARAAVEVADLPIDVGVEISFRARI
jgi:reactive intermediate/imine deaminase